METSKLNMELIALANEIPTGGSGRFICPACGGGPSSERSLLIRRARLQINCICFRNKCTLGTRRLTTAGTCMQYSDTSHTTMPKRLDHWAGETHPMTSEAYEKFNINPFEIDILLRVTDDGRLVIPIRDMHNIRRGDIVRQSKPYDIGMPKSLSLYDEDHDGLAWFYPAAVNSACHAPEVPVLCLVEDPLSALRIAAHGVTGVALLGTKLSPDRVATLRQWGDEQTRLGRTSVPIHLALDADAYLTAVAQTKRLYNQLDLRVHRLYHDVKDMDVAELWNFLRVLGV